MSYPSSFGKWNKPHSTGHVVGLEDHERQNFIDEVIIRNGGHRTVQILERIPKNTIKCINYDYRCTCELRKKPGSLIAVGIAHVEYKGKGSDPAGHAVVVVKDTITNKYHIINFNSHKIQNAYDKQENYITGGPLAKKKRSHLDVPEISDAEHLVNINLQGGAPICTLIAAANFKTVFEQCRNMDDVRAKFSGPELIQRLEDVKTLFGNRVINKGRHAGERVADYITAKQQMLAGQLASPTPRQIPLAQTTVTQKSHLPQLQQSTVAAGSPQTNITTPATTEQSDQDVPRPIRPKAFEPIVGDKGQKYNMSQATVLNRTPPPNLPLPSQAGSTIMQKIRKNPVIGCLRQDTSNINPKPVKLPPKAKAIRIVKKTGRIL